MQAIKYNVASINIRFDNPADQENSWDYRKQHLLEMIEYYSWDVIGFQEVCGHQLDFISKLPQYSYEGIGREGEASEHGPLFYKKDLFEKKDGGTFWLSRTPDSPSKSWGADCVRICTWLRLRDKQTDQEFVFVNTHLDHISEEARYQGSHMITEWIERYASDVPCVLTGDFNSDKEERCYREITSHLQDTRDAATAFHYGPAGTFTGFDYNIPWSELKKIDYIFASRNLTVLHTRTIVDSFDRRYPSDHFPITATLELQNNEGQKNEIKGAH